MIRIVRPTLALAALVLTGVAPPALAHVTYKNLDAAPVLVNRTFGSTTNNVVDPCTGQPSGCQSSNAFTRYGWRNGTTTQLGDSHFLTASAEFFKFHLNQTSTVTLTFTQLATQVAATPLNPALSVYGGLLVVGAHDNVTADPLNPVGGNGCAIASVTDAHLPPWTYQPHDGYRDTLNFSTTGGLLACKGKNPYVGQFDACASWSMADTGGAWSRISYLASKGATACVPTGGGTHTVGTAGASETLTLTLPAGDYTVAAGGEFCLSATGGAACTTPRLYGTLTYTHSP